MIFDDPDQPASTRMAALAQNLTSALNAGEMEGDAYTIALSTAFVLRHLCREVMHMEDGLNALAADAHAEIADDRLRQARAAWLRRDIAVHVGRREQLLTEQWTDNSALSV